MSYSSEATDVDTGRWVPGHLLLPLCVFLGLAVGAGCCGGVVTGGGVLGGIVAMGACFSVASLAMSSGRDADAIRARVQSQAANPALEEITVVAAALASLGGIAYVFIRNMVSDQAVATVALGITAVFATWFMLHMMYSTRYAHLYYTGEEGEWTSTRTPPLRPSASSGTCPSPSGCRSRCLIRWCARAG